MSKITEDKKNTSTQNSADQITKRSIELYGLTPEEISDENDIWMRKNGYKINQAGEPFPNLRPRSQSNIFSRLRSVLKRVHSKKKG